MSVTAAQRLRHALVQVSDLALKKYMTGRSILRRQTIRIDNEPRFIEQEGRSDELNRKSASSPAHPDQRPSSSHEKSLG